MKRSYLGCVVGTEVDHRLVREARVVVGPGVPGAPQTVATGRHWPRSTLCRVLLLEPHAGDVSQRVGRKRWKSYINGVAVSTFTSRPWLPADALSPGGRSSGRFARVRRQRRA